MNKQAELFVTQGQWMDPRKPEESVIDREAWRTEVYGVAKSRTQLSDWTANNKE